MGFTNPVTSVQLAAGDIPPSAAAIAAQIAIGGAPPIDKPQVIDNNSVPINNVAPVTLGPYDVTPWNTVMMEAGHLGAGVDVTLFQLTWYADAACTIPIDRDAFYSGDLSAAAHPVTRFEVPCKGAGLIVIAGPSSSPTPPSYRIVGTTRTVTKARYQNLCNLQLANITGFTSFGGGISNVFGFSGSFGAGIIGGQLTIPSRSGQCSFFFADASGTGGQCLILDAVSGLILDQFTVPASVNGVTANLVLPNRPVQVLYGGSPGGRFCQGAFTFADN
jgi:hypothetical protein